MHFQIAKQDIVGDVGDVGGALRTSYAWTLEKKEGPVCMSVERFGSEKEARSDIAAAKKSMSGAGRCKVVSPE